MGYLKNRAIVSGVWMMYILCSSAVRSQNVFYVYSVQGKVTVESKGKHRQLKIFDRMTDDDVFSLGVNSRFSFVAASDKRYYEAKQQGRFVVKSFVRERSKTVSANSNTIDYVLENFVQKGRLIIGDGFSSESGVVERGVDLNLIEYPFNRTVIYMARDFKPVFNDSLKKIRDEFTVNFIQDGTRYPELRVKSGDSVKIPIDAVDYAPLIFFCKWGEVTQSLRMIMADEDRMKELNQGLESLKSSFGGLSEFDSIMAQALYLEASGCHLDALRLYEVLENRKPEYRDAGLVKKYLSSH
jgi:hypothetical protein